MSGLYFDRAGQPLGLLEWAALAEDKGYKLVALDTVGEARVSTVWLGLDHRLGGEAGGGRPLIFETMVFGGPLDGECRRYSTEAEAVDGHAETVAAVRDAAPAGPFPTKLTVGVTPDFDPDAWHGRIISEDDGRSAPPDLYGSLVLAEGETPDRWDGTVAAVLALADGTFASYETFYGPTGNGFCEDAYGGDADLHVGSLAWVVTFGLTDEGRGLCGIPAGGIETWCRQVTARLEAQRG